VVDGEFIELNAGVGSAFFTLNVRVSRTFRLGRMGSSRLEAMVEGFNITNRTNVLARNAVFGTGAYPTNPLPDFGKVTAVGDPRSFQLGLRLTY
jgi:hypothetical protein